MSYHGMHEPNNGSAHCRYETSSICKFKLSVATNLNFIGTVID